MSNRYLLSPAAAGSHTLFYRMTAEGVIEVVRILHQWMDVDRHL